MPKATEGIPDNDAPRFGWWRRLPIIRQAETAECGLACIAMIANYHGYETDLLSLRRRLQVSLGGMTLSGLVDAFEVVGIQARPLKYDFAELRKLRMPCIVHVDLNHFVVLKHVRGNTITIHDPAVGRVTFSLHEASRRFTGVALEAFPGANFRRQRDVQRIDFGSLLGSVKGLKRALGKMFALAMVLEFLALLSPLLLQTVMDRILPAHDADLLLLFCIGFSGLLVVQTAIAAVRNWIVICASVNLGLSWTGNVFSHLLRLPDQYFRSRHAGDISSRFGAIDAIQHTLTSRVVEIVLDGCVGLFALAALCFYSVALSGLIGAGFFGYAVLRMLSLRIIREANLGQISAAAKQQTSFLEAVRGAAVIRLFNQTAAQSARHLNKAADTMNRGVALQSLELTFASAGSILFGALRIGTIYLGARLVMADRFSIGMLVAFLAYSDQFMSRATALVDFFVEIRMLRTQAERLADIVLTQPERNLHTRCKVDASELSGTLSCEALAYRYADNERWLLRGCTFNLAQGESLAIVGPSGCGKSTLVKLIMGMLDAQGGNILVGGVDITTLGKTLLRQNVVAILQEDLLFAGSIAQNIAFFDPDATQERIEEAARLASVHGEITRMPMRYDTPITDMGSALSTGQRQRVCLARALYRQPRILVLDEATNHLDIDNETAITEVLRARNISRLIVSHRPQTIAFADRVLALGNGQLFPIDGQTRERLQCR